MAHTYKTLGQSAPAAATPADLYTVPAATEAIVSTVVAANRSGTASNIRISVAVAGAVEANEQFYIYDFSLAGNDTYAATFGIAMAATDVLRVESSNATVSFNATGVEIT